MTKFKIDPKSGQLMVGTVLNFEPAGSIGNSQVYTVTDQGVRRPVQRELPMTDVVGSALQDVRRASGSSTRPATVRTTVYID